MLGDRDGAHRPPDFDILKPIPAPYLLAIHPANRIPSRLALRVFGVSHVRIESKTPEVELYPVVVGTRSEELVQLLPEPPCRLPKRQGCDVPAVEEIVPVCGAITVFLVRVLP